MTASTLDANTNQALRLTKQFLSNLPQVVRCDASVMDGLESELQESIVRARAAWPTVMVEDEMFVGHLAKSLSAQRTNLGLALANVRAADLYLACACAHGQKVAIEEFERTFIATVGPAVAGISPSKAFVQEVQQRLRAKLLVPGKRTPAIAQYNGVGSLRGWLRAAAVRTAIDLIRKRERPLRDERSELRDTEVCPEMELLKRRYQEDFNAAFRAALTAMSQRERTLLRFHCVDGLGIDKIAAIYHIGRSTAARWLVQIRVRMLEQTKRELQLRVGIPQDELPSLMRLLRSRLNVTLSRLLREPVVEFEATAQ